MKARLVPFVLALFAAPSAAQFGPQQAYVDVVNGDDANSGAHPNDAWRTLTWALAHVSPAASVHIAPGTYSIASGENFPLVVSSAVNLLGSPLDAVVVDAAGSDQTIFSLSANGQPVSFESLTLRNGAQGVAGFADASLSHVTIEDVLENGVAVSGSMVLSSVVLQSGYVGVVVGDDDVHLVDCVVRDFQWAGLVVHSDANLLVERCRITANLGFGVRQGVSDPLGFQSSLFRDCEISANEGAGFYFTGGGAGGFGLLAIERCTLAGNVDNNVTVGFTNASLLLSIHDSILAHGVADLAIAPNTNLQLSAKDSLVLDGSLDGVDGCFSADPLFRDADAGDYRLKYSSPCLDLGVANLGQATDLLGHPRVVDGDLDTLRKCDLGAFEFRPLEMQTTGQIGTPLQFELWGPEGAPTTLYWTRGALAGSPTQTPFGALHLQANLMRVFRVTTAGEDAPSIVQRIIPNSPALYGHTFAFQSLTDSQDAPSGKAYSNPVELHIALP